MAFGSRHVCLSMFFSGIFVYGIVELVAHTPLYTPMECEQWPSSSDLRVPALVGEWVNISGMVEISCTTSNPYVIRVSSRKVGSVFLKNGTGLELVGVSNSVDLGWGSILLANKVQTYRSSIEIGLPMHSATALLDRSTVQFVYEQHLRSASDFRLFGSTFNVMTTTLDTDEVCGFEWWPLDRRVGPSQCAPTMEELKIPSPYASPLPAKSLLHLNASGLAKQELKKNAFFGGILMVSLLGAIAPIACAWHAHRHGKVGDMEAVRNAPRGGRLGEV